MKQFIPIGIGLIHAALTLGTIAALVTFYPSALFSLEYVILVLLVPAILIPSGLIISQIMRKRSRWRTVWTGCVISIATSSLHFRFLAEAFMVV